MTVEAALNQLDSSDSGLSVKEADLRLKRDGKNIVKVKGDSLLKKILEPFLDVFTLILVVAAAISLWHGDTLDAIIIFVIIAISAIIFYVQRFSTDRVLKSLSKQNPQTVSVLRGGKVIKIDTTNLVRGDVVILNEGDKVPADIRVVKAASAQVNESQITGESLPVAKQASPIKTDKEIYDLTNMLFQGSFMISGTITGVVTSTGNQTEFGKLAELSKKAEPQSTIQKKINSLITKIIAVVFAISLVAFGLALLKGMEFVEAIRFVMALAVSAVPESLPIAIAVILVLGMRRMARRKAVVSQMRAIETIGSITTIATDKTGTLTKNKLSVNTTWSPESETELNKIIACSINQETSSSFDPLDIALSEYSRKQKVSSHGTPAYNLPFDQSMAMSATAWHFGSQYQLYIKGAPESVIKISDLDASSRKNIEAKLKTLTSKGYRVIALATAKVDKKVTKLSQLKNLPVEFAGLVAISDTLRAESKASISLALKAGIGVKMITGDHFETAYQIGKELNMVSRRSEVFDCRSMNKLSDAELEKIVNKTKIFSRVIPEQKYRLLTILKKQHITAMTGDGVNDVPALANAHVGIAMGSGSQIAKDAGDIILLDDNFKTIIDAVKEGRTVIANIRRMLFYLLSTNAGELLTILGALIFGSKIPLAPVQILWINLVTDTSMVIPLGLEPPEKDIMDQPPKKPNAPILPKFMIARIVLMAMTMALLSLAIYYFFEVVNGHLYAQTMVFTALVVSQWANAFNARSETESILTRIKILNPSFYVGLGISVAVQLTAIFSPLGGVLHLVSVNLWQLIVVSLIAFVVPIIVCEAHKSYCRISKVKRDSLLS